MMHGAQHDWRPMHLADAAIDVTRHKGQQLLHDAHITQLDCLCSIKLSMKTAQSKALGRTQMRIYMCAM